MERKINGMFILAVLALSLFLVASVSAVQLRPMNQLNHPGLTYPYVPSAEGSNHMGVSDYSSEFDWVSEICESDYQIRPANQQTWFLREALCNTD